MNYTLELKTQEIGSNVHFNTIKLDSFKINIVERYVTKTASKPKLSEVLFKVRTLQDEIIKRKDGTINMYIREEAFMKYQNLTNILFSYEYRRNLINRKEAEQDFVHFILTLAISNYQLT